MTTPPETHETQALDRGSHAWTSRSSDQEILAGRDVAGPALASLTHRFVGRDVVVLASPSASASGLLARCTAMLGREPAMVFDDLHGHPTSARSESIAERVRARHDDCVLLCIGGGSVSDTGKAVSLLLGESGSLNEYCGRRGPDGRYEFPELRQPKPPIVSIATTLSAAEVTPTAGTIDAAGHKLLLRDPQLVSRLVVLDTAVLEHVPPRVLLGSAFNALAHCVEALYSPTRNPVTDAVAQDGIRHLLAGLAPGDGPRRDVDLMALAAGAALSGLAISQARSGLQHAICHALGARFGTSHGDAHAIMLPAVLDFNLAVGSPTIDPILRAFGTTHPDEVSARLAELRARASLPQRLRALGISVTDLPAAAADVTREPGYLTNVRAVGGIPELTTILESAW